MPTLSTIRRVAVGLAVAPAVAALAFAGFNAADAGTPGTVRTGGATLTLRSAATTDSAALAHIPHGTRLTLDCKASGKNVAGNTTWNRVTHGGKTGYVSAAYVSGGTSASLPTCGTGVVRTDGATLTLRSAAASSSAALGSIPHGTTLTLQCRIDGSRQAGTQGTTSTWVKVTHGGRTGYVSAAYVAGGTSTAVGTCTGTVTAKPRPKPPTAPVTAGTFASPVPASAPVTSRFGPRWGTFHRGTDFGYRGMIHSACTGTVDTVKINRAYANRNSYPTSGTTNYVWVNCGNGIRMGYAHMYANQIPSWVKPGAKVTAGQAMFPVGNQGFSTGYHLHYEVKQNGTNVNPLTFLRSRGVGVPS